MERSASMKWMAIIAGGIGCIVAAMLFSASPALAGGLPSAGQLADGIFSGTVEMADSASAAYANAPQRVAAKVSSAKLKPGKKYTFYAYYGGVKLKYTLIVGKPKVTTKGKKKQAVITTTIQLKKPSTAQLVQLGIVANANKNAQINPGSSFSLVDADTGKPIENAKGVRVTETNLKYSKYTTLMAGQQPIPLKIKMTTTTVYPKKYAKVNIVLSKLNQKGEPTKNYVLPLK